ncbi:hypothetical protein [Chryseobacterium joostei]|uniref:hypothetical protein n=1 Tax=Chryseobacterium joostei TaxID=112234 RepID=UPI000F508503|nr:hypothetical protein [Chryseobacterium joostei]
MGMNTSNPKSTMDIVAKNSSGSSTLADGLLIPRVDRERAINMVSVQPSTLIYVNSITTGSATGQASNIDAVGFYYFDGSTNKWTKLSTDTNIYNTDGVLTSNRVMGLGNNSLIFRNGVEASLYFERSGTGNLQSGQNVANLYTSGYVGNTNKILSGIRTYYQGDGTNSNSSMKLTVNGNINNNVVLAANNNVGIGTETPSEKLDVEGNARIRTLVDIEGTNQIPRFTRRVMSDANGVLGYEPNISKSTYGLDNIYENAMSNQISTTITNGNVPLNLSNTIVVPANTEALIVIDYNIPILKKGGYVAYMGITLKKSTNGGADVELEQGSRKYTTPSYSDNSAPAQGFPIVGKAVDHITNNTSSPITIVYKPLGYVEDNITTVYFGMWTNSGTGANFNWGRGSMTVTSYLKSLQ